MTQPDGMFCGPCHKCGTSFWLPRPLYDAAKRSERISFFCPYGHEAVFREDESEADKMRRERDRAVQQLAQKDDEIRQLEQRGRVLAAQVEQHRAAAAKTVRRTKAGLCPCCNRSFTGLARHIRAKHPDFSAEETTA